jgi:hypothetical protein
VIGAGFTDLRFTLTGRGSSETIFGAGKIDCAKASRGALTTAGTSATDSYGGGAIVGKLVSRMMRSGHRWDELTRIIDLSNRASVWNVAKEAAGQ